jgi:rhodanese-related sulfurtransferase
MINLDSSMFAEKIVESDVVVLDVRTPEEFNSGHIPNAINIDIYSDYFNSDIAALDKSKSYAVYCRSGKRSVDASSEMDLIGFESTYNLTGGIIEWVDSGRETVN